jgi:hypothetical protein
MGANKIILNGKPLLDLTGDTVTEADVRIGVTFHKRNGEEAQGTYVAPQAPQTQEKSISVSENGQHYVLPDSGYYLSKVTVNAQFTPPENRLAAYLRKAIVDVQKADFEGVAAVPSNAFKSQSQLLTVDFPDSVTSYGTDVFYSSGLTTVYSLGKPTALSNYMFYKCTQLAGFEIPNTVTSIGKGAFQSCNNLGTVTIPSSVTDIGSGAFYNTATWSKDTFIMMGAIPPTIQSDTFYADSVETISIPYGSKSAYENATNWSALSSKLVERTS